MSSSRLCRTCAPSCLGFIQSVVFLPSRPSLAEMRTRTCMTEPIISSYAGQIASGKVEKKGPRNAIKLFYRSEYEGILEKYHSRCVAVLPKSPMPPFASLILSSRYFVHLCSDLIAKFQSSYHCKCSLFQANTISAQLTFFIGAWSPLQRWRLPLLRTDQQARSRLLTSCCKAPDHRRM